MNNLELYEKFRKVPQEAKKSIAGGRLKGFTDINPVWRMKVLTEHFGPVGIGWKYVITEKRLERGVNDEIAAFVDVDLFIKHEGQWSEAIPGTGGSMFVAKETNGLKVSDECFKMALTDALSVACKALGVGADVYFEKDKTKYTHESHEEDRNGNKTGKTTNDTTTKVAPLKTNPSESIATCSECGTDVDQKVNDYSISKYKKCLCRACQKAVS